MVQTDVVNTGRTTIFLTTEFRPLPHAEDASFLHVLLPEEASVSKHMLLDRVP
jgi:hypothetical protein